MSLDPSFPLVVLGARIEGGWEYIWAGYGLTWVSVSAYVYLLRRRLKALSRAEP